MIPESPSMKSTICNGLPRFQFPGLAGLAGLEHGIFTRQGGVSAPPFASLNLGTVEGDRPADVEKNRQSVAGCFANHTLVFVKQVHGSRVRVFANDRLPDPFETAQMEGDALVSDIPGLLLGVKLADCQSVILFDPVRKVAANIHSGWRGSVANIIGTTIGVMVDTFSCRPADMYAGISPSLGPCCAEFINYKKEFPRHLWSYRDGRDHFDFWAVSRDQLQTAGIPENRIETAGLCTRCRTDLFFSYRAEGRTGRFAVAAGLSPGL